MESVFCIAATGLESSRKKKMTTEKSSLEQPKGYMELVEENLRFRAALTRIIEANYGHEARKIARSVLSK